MEENDYYDLKILLWLVLFLIFGIIIITCKPDRGEYIMTVRGLISADETGITLEHEHILVDFIGADSTGYYRWNRDSVIEKALPYVLDAKNRGVKTFIDCTPAYIGRDPVLLRSLSESTGMNFITNTGYYGSGRNRYIPDTFYDMDDSAVARIWINEYENGIEDTGIKPGFIKISVDPDNPLSAEHIKIIKAAAITHLRTGLVIASHTGPDDPAFEQIELLKEMAVDPSAFIWVHAQGGTLEGNIRAAKERAWISFDNIRSGGGMDPSVRFSIQWYADRINEMKKNGLLSRVLISHDSGWYDPDKPGGGTFTTYTDIFDYFIPVLKAIGFTGKEIEQILIKNPQEAFNVKIRPF